MHIATTLGLLLGASLIAGVVAEYIRLPKVTAYLLAGLLLGPGLFDLVPHEQVHALDPMLKLAMALVLFGLGGQFPLSRIRKILPKALALSAGELLMTFLLVTIGLWLTGVSARQSLLLGCLALATAPATTVLVFKELKSEGPVTEFAGVLVAINNLAAVVAFEFAFVTMQAFDPQSSSVAWQQALELMLDFGGAIASGLIAGLAVAFGCEMLSTTRWLALLVASSTLVLGVCETFGMPYMLAFLVMGFTAASLSDVRQQIIRELNHVGGLLAVLFFAVHGTELDLPAFAAAGGVGVAYIILRSLGKVAGTWAGARISGQTTEVRRWLGPTLLAQAGAAIALATLAVDRAPALGRPVQTVILGSVVFFEILGPLMIRVAALRAGEVPLTTAIERVSHSPLDEARGLWDNFLNMIGWRGSADAARRTIPVSSLTRRNVAGIPLSATFDQVIAHISHSRDNAWPVVDEKGGLAGLIHFSLLNNVLFAPDDSRLIRAIDLMTPVELTLHPDDAVERAGELFQKTPDDALPVVSPDESASLLGIIRRSDVMHILIRRHGRA